MKEKVLKALANPPRIFYVPYSLAILNFFIWFMLFIILMVVFLIFTENIPSLLPLFFLGFLFISHLILSIFSRRDSQISQIISARFNLLKRKIPNKLVS